MQSFDRDFCWVQVYFPDHKVKGTAGGQAGGQQPRKVTSTPSWDHALQNSYSIIQGDRGMQGLGVLYRLCF
jgi:hypothetical protein